MGKGGALQKNLYRVRAAHTPAFEENGRKGGFLLRAPPLGLRGTDIKSLKKNLEGKKRKDRGKLPITGRTDKDSWGGALVDWGGKINSKEKPLPNIPPRKTGDTVEFQEKYDKMKTRKNGLFKGKRGPKLPFDASKNPTGT